jgi:hypothetical protein
LCAFLGSNICSNFARAFRSGPGALRAGGGAGGGVAAPQPRGRGQGRTGGVAAGAPSAWCGSRSIRSAGRPRRPNYFCRRHSRGPLMVVAVMRRDALVRAARLRDGDDDGGGRLRPCSCRRRRRGLLSAQLAQPRRAARRRQGGPPGGRSLADSAVLIRTEEEMEKRRGISVTVSVLIMIIAIDMKWTETCGVVLVRDVLRCAAGEMEAHTQVVFWMRCTGCPAGDTPQYPPPM